VMVACSSAWLRRTEPMRSASMCCAPSRMLCTSIAIACETKS